MMRFKARTAAMVLAAILGGAAAHADSTDPDLIFRKSTTFKLLTPNDKLAVYGVDDPLVEGVACHYTAPEKGGLMGALGLAEQTSDISLACRQYGPIKFNGKSGQGDVVFSRAPLGVLQEDADRARLRRQAQHPGLHDLHGQAGRRLAEELDLDRADSALGRAERHAQVRRLHQVKLSRRI